MAESGDGNGGGGGTTADDPGRWLDIQQQQEQQQQEQRQVKQALAVTVVGQPTERPTARGDGESVRVSDRESEKREEEPPAPPPPSSGEPPTCFHGPAARLLHLAFCIFSPTSR